MARAGVVLERDGVCRNSHLSPKGHARHTRHADHTTTNLQVKAPSADLSGSLGLAWICMRSALAKSSRLDSAGTDP